LDRLLSSYRANSKEEESESRENQSAPGTTLYYDGETEKRNRKEQKREQKRGQRTEKNRKEGTEKRTGLVFPVGSNQPLHVTGQLRLQLNFKSSGPHVNLVVRPRARMATCSAIFASKMR
jgi:hypothetical protein